MGDEIADTDGPERVDCAGSERRDGLSRRQARGGRSHCRGRAPACLSEPAQCGGAAVAEADRGEGVYQRWQMSLLKPREAVRELLRERGELIVVAGLGAPAYDLASCGNQPLDFPLWGAMGGAAMVGLGLALAQPERKVLVLTGDGELLMGLGSLATIAAQRPPNLRIVVLDNESYGETGQQRTHTAMGVDPAAVAG